MAGQSKILISQCLLGCNTKYDGENNKIDFSCLPLDRLIPICPEQLGGLATPRDPSEIKNDYIIDSKGINRTEEFKKGASESLRIGQLFNAKFALLKENSPSCGVNFIYDGTFSGVKISGSGVTTKLLKRNGIKVFSEENIEELLKEI